MRDRSADESIVPCDPVPKWYSLALVPPEPLARVFASQRARFDLKHPTTIPHITMKLAFMLGQGSLRAQDDLMAWVHGACRSQRPFEVSLDDVGVFSSDSGHRHVVYVAVRPTPRLVELHDRLVRGLAGAGARTPGISAEREAALFFPHLTLALGLTAEEAHAALTVARRELAPARFLADRLVIGRSAEGLRWKVVEDVGFCGAVMASEPSYDARRAESLL